MVILTLFLSRSPFFVYLSKHWIYLKLDRKMKTPMDRTNFFLLLLFSKSHLCVTLFFLSLLSQFSIGRLIYFIDFPHNMVKKTGWLWHYWCQKYHFVIFRSQKLQWFINLFFYFFSFSTKVTIVYPLTLLNFY